MKFWCMCIIRRRCIAFETLVSLDFLLDGTFFCPPRVEDQVPRASMAWLLGRLNPIFRFSPLPPPPPLPLLCFNSLYFALLCSPYPKSFGSGYPPFTSWQQQTCQSSTQKARMMVSARSEPHSLVQILFMEVVKLKVQKC